MSPFGVTTVEAATPRASGAAPPPALACHEVVVRFGQLRALGGVSLEFATGRLHCVVGQNGAGKTTLARLIAGLIKPDAGRISVAGQDIPTGDVTESRRAGVELVHQSFTLPPSFSVAEALELFSTGPRGAPVYRMAQLRERWREHLERSGLDIDPSARIRDLPIEALQAVEVTRALAADARVLILDEPTAVLPPPAIERLFERLRRLRESGVTVIVVLHKLHEVAAVAETIAVLRDGVVVLPPTDVAGTTPRQLSDLIVGSGRSEAITPMETVAAAVEGSPGTEWALLELEDVSTQPSSTERGLSHVSLRVRAGEIVGVAGVEGNGQRELVGVITGLLHATAGRISLVGHDIGPRPPAERRARGIRVVPFDRNTQGVSQSTSLWENVAVLPVTTTSRSLASVLNLGRLRDSARQSLDQWSVRYQSLDQRAGELSGGNVQRLILARELSAGVSLLVAAQPTRGLDIAATAFVHTTLRELRDSTGGVVLISSDLDELFELSDRLVVMLGGRIVAELKPPYDVGSVGAAMVGAHSDGREVPAAAVANEGASR
ncbi:ABC transporter ATP-binding protein [soil metagenome]